MLPNSQKIKLGQVLTSVQFAPAAAPRPVALPAAPVCRHPSQPAVPPPAAVIEDEAENAEDAYERGHREGRQQAQSELAESADAVRKIAEALQRESKEMRRAIDRFATLLSLRIAAKIIGREVTEAEAVQRMIAHALAQVPVRENLSIRLNPKDIEVLTPLRGKMLDKSILLPEDVMFIPDESIHRGGCIISSALGQLDARVETHLSFIEKAMLSNEPR